MHSIWFSKHMSEKACFLTQKMQLRIMEQVQIRRNVMYTLAKKLKTNINEKDKTEIRNISKRYRIPEERVFAAYVTLISRNWTYSDARRIILAALEGEPACWIF